VSKQQQAFLIDAKPTGDLCICAN